MAELAELPALETLDLTHSKLSNSGLAGLEKLSHVRALDLGSCQVSDAGMEHVAKLKSLWFLSLSFTQERAGNNFLISSWRFERVSRPRRLLDRGSTALHRFGLSATCGF